MNIPLLLEMTAEGAGDRVAVGSGPGAITYAGLVNRSRRIASWLTSIGAGRLALLDVNSPALPVALFGAATAGLPFCPVNYRLSPAQLADVFERLTPATVVAGPSVQHLLPLGLEAMERASFLARSEDDGRPEPGGDVPGTPGFVDPETVAVLLFTSGTSGSPKVAVLRHRHLAAYIMSTVEFLGAAEDEAALISVPPYHVAAISALLSSTWAGRRIVQLESFTAESWVDLAATEAVTHAMVVPTMLSRILEVLEHHPGGLPALRHLSYGGGRMPVPVVERALALLPQVDFVNAYGLTETSSTISVLSPEDHRLAVSAPEPSVRRRLGSVGRPVPSVEVQIRETDGAVAPPEHSGGIWVRGDQVSGEYLGRNSGVVDGWLDTRDGGWLDDKGYLFVEGRLDDVIVRGGENLSPGEIEEVLGLHPAVSDVGVVGVADPEWGEQVAAAVVVVPGQDVSPDELRQWVRDRLRSSRVPATITFVEALPYTDSGKLLRRVLKVELAGTGARSGRTPLPADRP